MNHALNSTMFVCMYCLMGLVSVLLLVLVGAVLVSSRVDDIV